MNLTYMYDAGAFDDGKWICTRCRLRNQATHLHLSVKRGKESLLLEFKGRCNVHKDSGDVTLVEIRAALGSIASHNLQH